MFSVTGMPQALRDRSNARATALRGANASTFSPPFLSIRPARSDTNAFKVIYCKVLILNVLQYFLSRKFLPFSDLPIRIGKDTSMPPYAYKAQMH